MLTAKVMLCCKQMYCLATMAQYLPTGKHPVEKHTQWRSVLLKLETLTLEY